MAGSALEDWPRCYNFKDEEGRCHGAVSGWGAGRGEGSGVCYWQNMCSWRLVEWTVMKTTCLGEGLNASCRESWGRSDTDVAAVDRVE